MLEHRLSALLQLHLHSRLNTWLEWMSKDKCKTRLETFKFCDLVRLILEGKCNIYPFLNFLFSRIDVKIVDLNNLGYLKIAQYFLILFKFLSVWLVITLYTLNYCAETNWSIVIIHQPCWDSQSSMAKISLNSPTSTSWLLSNIRARSHTLKQMSNQRVYHNISNNILSTLKSVMNMIDVDKV